MVGVFVMSDDSEFLRKAGLEDQRIYLFETEEAAELWQLQTLILAGEIAEVDGCYRLSSERALVAIDISDPCSPSEVIDAWQSTGDMLEFFHVYDVAEVP